VLRHCPRFAEAHNQLAIAHFLKGDYEGAVRHSKCALLLNGYHFGALAGLGHSYAALGRLHEAMASYQLALRLNPRLEGIRQSIRAVRTRLRERQPDEAPSGPAVLPSLAVTPDDATTPTHE
jgi:tetratricopeptide (TPR) repeat protein